MAYFQLSFSNVQGQNVRARVTFPNDCYIADGGEIAVPVGQRIDPGTYGYTVFYDEDTSNPCNPTDTTREWTLPYTPNQSGTRLTVFLVERATGDVKDSKENDDDVDED